LSTQITVHVVETATASGRRPALLLDTRSIEDWFREASGGELLLTLRPCQLPYDTNECTGSILHRLTREVLPQPGAAPLADIALLLCGAWKLPATLPSGSVLGLMFDWNGGDEVGTFNTSNGVPREGCAIFLNEFTGPDEEATAADIAWNAIHEIGHVFNLVHDDSGRSFMAEGGKSRPGINHSFSSDDRHALTLAANGMNPSYSKIYLPGGDDFRASTAGSLRPNSATRFRLRAHIGKRRFLLGEPVVLDLTLTAASDAWVSPALDTGYASFDIWYQRPDGEVRRHNPAVHFCRTHKRRFRLSHSTPLRHNPRIHVDRDGLVFRTPGEYRLWATLAVQPSLRPRYVRSNDATFELRLPRDQAEVQISELLRRPDIARAVGEGRGVLSSRSRRLMYSTIDKHFSHEALASVRYQLAKRSVANQRYGLATTYLSNLKLVQPSLAAGAGRLRRVLRGR
jgi:hypothetical protein